MRKTHLLSFKHDGYRFSDATSLISSLEYVSICLLVGSLDNRTLCAIIM